MLDRRGSNQPNVSFSPVCSLPDLMSLSSWLRLGPNSMNAFHSVKTRGRTSALTKLEGRQRAAGRRRRLQAQGPVGEGLVAVDLPAHVHAGVAEGVVHVALDVGHRFGLPQADGLGPVSVRVKLESAGAGRDVLVFDQLDATLQGRRRVGEA